MMGWTYLEGSEVNPPALAPGAEARLGKLHALGALAQRPAERLAERHVAQKQLPLDPEGIVIRAGVGHLGPSPMEVQRLVHVRVPNRARRRVDRLDPALPKARHRKTLGAVHLRVKRSSRRTRTHQELLKWQTIPFSRRNVA